MGRNPATGALEPLDFNNLLSVLPEFKQIETAVDVHPFAAPIDSSDVSPKDWASMARIITEHYDDYDGFVILHGTDTMAYTASALSFMLENLTKPVILTGSQLPMGQLRTDGKENMLTSIELAGEYDSEGHPLVPEVSIYFNGHLLRGNRATKCSADEFFAFTTYNYPHLCDAGVDFVFHDHHILRPDYSKPMIPHYAMNSNVMSKNDDIRILYIFCGQFILDTDGALGFNLALAPCFFRCLLNFLGNDVSVCNTRCTCGNSNNLHDELLSLKPFTALLPKIYRSQISE